MYLTNIVEVTLCLCIVQGNLCFALEVVDHGNKTTIRAIGAL